MNGEVRMRSGSSISTMSSIDGSVDSGTSSEISSSSGWQRQRNRTSPVFHYIGELMRPAREGPGLQPIWMCSLCEAPAVSPEWETDNTSNFWKHIETHHHATYAQLRRPKQLSESVEHDSRSGKNDSFTNSDSANATAAMVRLIVNHAHAFALVEQKAFVEYSNSLRSQYKVPCRQTVGKKVKQAWAEQKDIVRKALRWDLRDGKRSSLTTDLWTSSANRGYMVVTVHYIDDRWRLRSLIVAFVRVVYPHTGERLASNLLHVITEMDPVLVSSMWTITADNAGNNKTMADPMWRTNGK